MTRVNEMSPIIDFYNPGTRRLMRPLFNWRYLHQTARNLAAAFRSVHERGGVIADVNCRNVLASERALVTLVDTDSFQIRDPQSGHIYRCPVGTAEYTPPELQGRDLATVDRTSQHDCFGLAVIIFSILMEGTHPFAGVFIGKGDPPPYEERIRLGHFTYSGKNNVPYRPMPIAPSFGILNPSLQRLFIRCFEEGHRDPAARPDAQAWRTALEEAESCLSVCSRNSQHYYGNHLSICPWCERARQLGGRDPFPSPQDVRKAPPAPGRSRAQNIPIHIAVRRSKASSSMLRRLQQTTSSSQLQRQTATTPRGAAQRQPARLVRWYLAFVDWLGVLLTSDLFVAQLIGMFIGIFAMAAVLAVGIGVIALIVLGISALFEGKETVRLWNAADGRLLHKMPAGNPVIWSPDGKMLATPGGECRDSHGCSVKVWDASSGRLLYTAGNLERRVDIVWSPDGKILATAGADLTLWDGRNGQLLRKLVSQDEKLLWSPDGKLLASGGCALEDCTVRLWDNSSHELLRTVHYRYEVALPLTGPWIDMSWSRDSKTLATTNSRDTALRLWDAADGTLLKTFEVHISDQVTDRRLAWSPDGTMLAGLSERDTIRLWEASSGKLLRTFSGHGWVDSFAWSPDGKILAIADFDEINLWEASSGQVLRTLEGHRLDSNLLAWNPDGKTLASGSLDRSIIVWDAGSGEPLRSLEAGGRVQALAWSPDGETLAASDDGGGH
jgi:WD40 repeat protein